MKAKNIFLVGPPNAGKTSLYNWLTHSKAKTVNYPGSTVDYLVGPLSDSASQVIDTPGVYSLFPQSQDEQVTLQVLTEAPQFINEQKAILVVIDASRIDTHLSLLMQVSQTKIPFAVALTMQDLVSPDRQKFLSTQLKNMFQAEVFWVDGRLGGGVIELSQYLRETLGSQLISSAPSLERWQEKQYRDSLAQTLKLQLNTQSKSKAVLQSERIDRLVLHPIFGLFLFIFIMLGLFSAIFWGAQPFMELMDGLVGSLAASAGDLLGAGLLSQFVTDGVISAFGSVLIFVPQIFLLFFIIGLLEGSGYLARASTVLDHPLSRIGLNGRSFVPLLSGYACAVPALLASRTINSPKERFLTNFLIPLMSCSARLPVYALLLSLLFRGDMAWKPGLVLAIIYLGSALMGVVISSILQKFIKSEKSSHFLMELPLYRWPQLSVVLKQTFNKTKSYFFRAGPVIAVLTLLIWVFTTFPNYQLPAEQRMESSYLGQLGKVIEPAFTPMGVDWRVGVGILSSFAAREVFVATTATMFNLSSEDSENESLISALAVAKFADGRFIFSTASIVALVLFFMVALQCATTVAMAIKEFNSFKMAMIQLAFYNLLAYGLAVASYQVLSRFLA